MNRRSFSKRIGLATLGASCPELGAARRLWGAVTPADETLGRLSIPLESAPELKEVGATVRLGLSPLRGSGAQLKPENQKFYPILITRANATDFLAIESNCAHESYVVDRVAGSDFLRCPVHGSTFGLDGVRRFGPASANLKRFETCLDVPRQSLDIFIPFMRYDLEISKSPSVTGRLKIRMTARFSVTYQVFRQERLGDPWEPAWFSLSESGPLDQTELNTDDFDRKIDLFVEPTAETTFFEVRADIHPR